MKIYNEVLPPNKELFNRMVVLAAGLAGVSDGVDQNPEYTRGMAELILDTVGVSQEWVEELTSLIVTKAEDTGMPYKDPIQPASYYVLDGDTLIYQLDLHPDSYQILATRSISKRDGDMLIARYTDQSRLRPATLEDFEYFRVSPKGHLHA